MALGRRRLLVLGLGGGALCAGVLGCGSGASAPVALQPEIPAGNAASVAVGTLRPIPGAPVAVGRDSGGIFALSLICTHAGCDMSQNGSVSFGRIDCGCHGSIFDGQGNVQRGPANQPLPHLLVTAEASGALTVHGDSVTSPSTRLQA
jgi:Rieske Fe-S protein